MHVRLKCKANVGGNYPPENHERTYGLPYLRRHVTQRGHDVYNGRANRYEFTNFGERDPRMCELFCAWQNAHGFSRRRNGTRKVRENV